MSQDNNNGSSGNPALGLLGAGISTIGNVVNGFFQRSYDERMRDKEWARSLEQWNRENAYNHPAAVTQRMKEAGINPALAYMNGASFAPAAASPDVGEVRSKGFGLQTDPMTLASIKVADAQADALRADAEQKRSTVPVNEQTVIHLQKQVDEIEEKISVYRSQAAVYDSQVFSNRSQAGMYIELTNKAHEENRRLKATFDDYLRDVKGGADLTTAKANQIVSELRAHRNALISQAEYYRKNAKLHEKQGSFLDKQIATYDRQFEAEMKKISAIIDDFGSQIHRRNVQSKMDAVDAFFKGIESAQSQSRMFLDAFDALTPW